MRSINLPTTAKPISVPNGKASKAKPKEPSVNDRAVFISGMRGIHWPRTADSKKNTRNMAIAAGVVRTVSNISLAQ